MFAADAARNVPYDRHILYLRHHVTRCDVNNYVNKNVNNFLIKIASKDFAVSKKVPTFALAKASRTLRRLEWRDSSVG